MSEQFERDLAHVLRDSTPEPDFDEVYGGALRRTGQRRRRRQAGVASSVLGGVGVAALSASLAFGGGMGWGGLGRDVSASTTSGTTASTVRVLGNTTAERVATLPITSRTWSGSADNRLVESAYFKLVGDCMKEKGFPDFPEILPSGYESTRGPWDTETNGETWPSEPLAFVETMSPAEQERFGKALGGETVSVDSVMGTPKRSATGCLDDAFDHLMDGIEGSTKQLQPSAQLTALEDQAWEKLLELPEYKALESRLSTCVETSGSYLPDGWAGPRPHGFSSTEQDTARVECFAQTGFLEAAYPLLAEQQRQVAEENTDLLAEWDATQAEVVARAREVLEVGETPSPTTSSAPTPSPTPPSSPTVPPTVPPVPPTQSLQDLIRVNPVLLTDNARGASTLTSPQIGPCSRAVGLTKFPARGQGRAMFAYCQASGDIELMRVLPAATSAQDFVVALLSEGSAQEKQAGFLHDAVLAPGQQLVIQSQVVGDTTVVRIPMALPSGMTDYAIPHDVLVLSLLSAVETERVSLVLDETPICHERESC